MKKMGEFFWTAWLLFVLAAYVFLVILPKLPGRA